VGAVPTAITNNLNFGNPLKAHIYYQLRESVLGIVDACEMFETPVTGGNVSLFNETDGVAIYPTPVIGMVGVIDDVSKITPQSFQNVGDHVIVLGTNTGEIGGSEYLYVSADLVAGVPPSIDLEGERMLQRAILKMNQERLISSAHDCSDGGLACALAECALGSGENPFGVSAEVDEDLRPVVSLFGEAQGRIVVSCTPASSEELLRIAEQHGVPASTIGAVLDKSEGYSLTVRDGSISAPIDGLAEVYFQSIANIMDTSPASGD
jgi:phosphoribosylformylglycinamidine (FGAM) synthase-like enzyme